MALALTIGPLVGLGLTSAPADAATPGTCTVNSGAPAAVTFVNNSPGPVKVNWVGYDCREKTYTTLASGTSYVQQSYTGHLWVIRRASDNTALNGVRPVLPRDVFLADGNGVCSVDGPKVPWSLRNQTGQALEMFFVDRACNEVSYGTVGAGATRGFTSVVGHRWRLKVAGTDKVVGETSVLRAETVTFSTPVAPVLARSTADRGDESSGRQVKVLYALPSDGPDRRWDVNGRIGLSLAAGNRWLQDQSGGRRVRLDTSNGAPDITFVRLRRTAAQYAGFGVRARDEIERDLKAQGFAAPNKLYLAFYQGAGTACGTSFWPPTLAGTTSVVFLQTCPREGLSADAGRFGFTEAAWLHEVFHGLGAAPTCAPHHTRDGHVSDDPSDLMYAGDREWRPALLDAGRDDYWTSAASCPGLPQSGFFP